MLRCGECIMEHGTWNVELGATPTRIRVLQQQQRLRYWRLFRFDLCIFNGGPKT